MTTVAKDIRGSWAAEDMIELTASTVLIVDTHKIYDGKIVTRAAVHTRDGDFITHVMFQDYSKQLTVSKVRCTEKNVAAQHAEAMLQIDDVRGAINLHYTAKAAI